MDRVLNELRRSSDSDGEVTAEHDVATASGESVKSRFSVVALKPIAMGLLLLACMASAFAAVLQRGGAESEQGSTVIAEGGPQPSGSPVSTTTGGDGYGEEQENGPESVTERDRAADQSVTGRFDRSTGTAPAGSTTTTVGGSTSVPPVAPSITTPSSTEAPTTLAPTTTELPSTTESPSTTELPSTTEAPPAPDWTLLHRYDFGPSGSPVEAGYVGISPGHTGAVGFSGGDLKSVDRAGGPLMRQDLVYASGQRTFRHPLGNGVYRVSITMGDEGHFHDEMGVESEGVVLASGLTTAAGEFEVITSVIEVTDSELTIWFQDKGGKNQDWVLNGLSIEIDRNNPPGP